MRLINQFFPLVRVDVASKNSRGPFCKNLKSCRNYFRFLYDKEIIRNIPVKNFPEKKIAEYFHEGHAEKNSTVDILKKILEKIMLVSYYYVCNINHNSHT